MDIGQIFEQKLLNEGQKLYQENRVYILEETSHSVKALVYDYYYYLVSLMFNENHIVIYLSITKDGIREKNPFKVPYGAALMVHLSQNEKYNLYNSKTLEPFETDSQEAYFASNLEEISCYKDNLFELTKHILRIQNYNTDAQIYTFSQSIDHVFEYFDSIQCLRKKLVAIQTFIHFYSKLSFDFENKDIHYAILDECNQRIDLTLNQIKNPFHRYFYHSLLLLDDHLYPYLCDYNKRSRLDFSIRKHAH